MDFFWYIYARRLLIGSTHWGVAAWIVIIQLGTYKKASHNQKSNHIVGWLEYAEDSEINKFIKILTGFLGKNQKGEL